MNIKKLLLVILIVGGSLFAFSGQDSKKVAIVKLVRGNAQMLAPDGEKGKIKKGQWLKEGTIIKTSGKTFVRLSFIDKSSMNIGPKSELKIEKFSKSEAGVINVLTGKIRSQVTKDYLKMDKDKSKLFVKSRNAVMGVRGTDFLFSTNKRSGATTTVLFEGSIVFNKIKPGESLRDLEAIVNKGRRIKPGEVSVAMKRYKKPTVPAKMNAQQFEGLNKNKTFEVSNEKNVKSVKSRVPAGLTGDVVSSDNTQLKQEIKKVIKVDLDNGSNQQNKVSVDMESSKGFVKGDDVKPADGVMVHVDTGIVIPPGADSSFDQNSGQWISTTNGGVSQAGEYIPPEGYSVTDEGQLVKLDPSGGKPEMVEIDIKPVDEMPTLEAVPRKKIDSTNIDDASGPEPAGTLDDPSDSNILEQPPLPEDCSTCNQPPNLFKEGGAVLPPPPSKTRVKIKVNKR